MGRHEARLAFVIATRSLIINGVPGAWIYVLSQEDIRQVPYTETDRSR